ncbi:sodium/potassium/calcium exchanger 1-like [Megalops cyprinoides]|uniref:sodium/potassium/calcium exchanger 1-like n=1 Tax=Megalops cyprinoides TaxID=118141 RepID=UPI0018655886|nr:sodium/potassium/calcium exchanger 1-like [Megalops cyprinoides]
MLPPQRKRLKCSRIAFLLTTVLLCCIYQLALRARLPEPWAEQLSEGDPQKEEGIVLQMVRRELEELEVLNQTVESVTVENLTVTTTTISPTTTTEPPTTELKHCVFVDPDASKPGVVPATPPIATPVPNTTHPPHGDAPHRKGEYPEDIFTVEERQRGWVVLHIFGMVYMFVSLAIVCDEFFVPALGVITDKLQISDDVAGATFMAAGGSAPELFTSLIGVFIAHSNVGIGTIVGSAVFNILFVIGMCALFSKEMLYLTWWPLFRDVSFYTLDLIMLIIFFLDNSIMWWESMLLVMGYASYVYFMKYNVQIEQAFKAQLNKHKSIVKVIALEEPDKVSAALSRSVRPAYSLPSPPQDKNHLKKPVLQRGGSSASLHNSTMRTTIFHLMIHTLDPLGEVKFKDKAEILNKMATGKMECKKPHTKTEDESGGKTEHPNAVNEEESPPPEPSTSQPPAEGEKDQCAEESSSSDSSSSSSSDSSSDDSDEEEEEEEQEEPLTLEWPDTPRKQATFLFLLPVVFPLWLTIPDVRNPAAKQYFAATFLGSIMWIAVFSYLMVWWAHQVGETIGISEEIMGLTILAAGTSIPDLITSVIVARKGLGDMAVSSSVGSNIFDITVGLPIPWLIYSIFNDLDPVTVSSNGLFCAIVLLFLMLLFVIISIAVCKWRMSKLLGLTMFMLYFLFLLLSVMLEDRIIICPVSI